MVPEVHRRESASIGFGGVVQEYREWNGEGGGRGTIREAGGLSVRAFWGGGEGGRKGWKKG